MSNLFAHLNCLSVWNLRWALLGCLDSNMVSWYSCVPAAGGTCEWSLLVGWIVPPKLADHSVPWFGLVAFGRVEVREAAACSIAIVRKSQRATHLWSHHSSCNYQHKWNLGPWNKAICFSQLLAEACLYREKNGSTKWQDYWGRKHSNNTASSLSNKVELWWRSECI